MAIVYEEGVAGRSYSGPSVWTMDGTKGYLRHYANELYLSFVAGNSLATRQERAQAEKELITCRRKLDFWRNHPNYVHADAVRGMEQLKREWRV